MKYIDESSKMPEENTFVSTDFDKRGGIVINSKEMSYARKTTTENTKKYYIKTHKNIPYDPWGMYAHRESYLETKFKSVSKDTFDYYMMYLKTRNSIYMTRSQRSFIND